MIEAGLSLMIDVANWSIVVLSVVLFAVVFAGAVGLICLFAENLKDKRK